MEKKAQALSLELISQIQKNLKTDDKELQSLIDVLPYFAKDMARLIIQPKLDIDYNFEVIDSFEDEKHHITLLRVLHSIKPVYCIKKIKMMSYPKRAEFLGEKGLNYLKTTYPEKIKNLKLYSFACKRGLHRDYIPGLITSEINGRFERTLLTLNNCVIGKDNVIAVFRQL